MGAIAVTAETFQKDVLDQKGLVFVDFYATWCGPCKMTSPIIEELATENPDIKFVKIDVDQNGELAGKYNVFSIPTFVVLRDGQVIHQFAGGMGKEAFLEELAKAKGGA